MSNKVAAAEGIRGIACFMVVLSHLSLCFFPGLHAFDPSRLGSSPLETAFHNSPFTFVISGSAAVYIFFVLSGYVLSYAICNGKDPVFRLKSMLVKRLPRLFLPSAVSIVLLWIAFTTLHPATADLSEWVGKLGKPVGPFSDVLYDATIRTFWEGWSMYNWVLWTMKIELVGSLLVFGLLYARFKQLNLYVVTPIALAICYALIRFVPFDFKQQIATLPWQTFVENNLEMLCFLFGMLFFFRFRQMSNGLAALLLILGLYCAGVHDNSLSYKWSNPYFYNRSYNVMNFLAGPLIVAPILMNHALSNLLSSKIPVYLGKISFAAYLTHLLVIYVIGLPLFNYINDSSLDISYTLTAMIPIVTVIVCTILFSELYYRVVDKGAIKISGKLSDLVLKRK